MPKWEEITKLKHQVTSNMRPVFQAIVFSGEDNNLLEAIRFDLPPGNRTTLN